MRIQWLTRDKRCVLAIEFLEIFNPVVIHKDSEILNKILWNFFRMTTEFSGMTTTARFEIRNSRFLKFGAFV